MRRIRCPHCNEYGFPTGNLPKEVIAVLSCDQCGELSVLFRGKVIALDKKVLESGTFDERKNHLAEVISHFLEPGFFPMTPSMDQAGPAFHLPSFKPSQQADAPRSVRPSPISDQEMDRFIKIDLKCLDNPAYFRKIFG